MTVIAAIKANGNVYMGCDSIFMDTQSYQTVKRTQSKLIIKDEIILGLTSGNGCRIFQLLKYKLKLPSTRKLKNDDLLEYLVVHFCSRLYKLLHAENLLQEDDSRKNSEPSMSPIELIVGIRDRMYQIGEDFDVAELDMSFYAIGTGGEYALGSLDATTNLCSSLTPEEHLIQAMKASEKFTASVKGPYQLCNTGDLCLSEWS